MYDVEPFLVAKADPTGMLDKEHLNRYGNRITLTIRDKVKIFDLDTLQKVQNSEDKASGTYLAGELLSTESLMDPQKYVSTEHRCGTIS